MTVHILVAPAATGKTAYVVNLARDAARRLRATPLVVTPTHLQVRALRRRLATAGGAIGVRVLTFDRLYALCLNAAGEAYTELSEPVQYRLIRSLVDDLQYYAPLANCPGFIQILQKLINELKAARIHPDAFARAAEGLGGHPRLTELAQVYAAYQRQLQTQGWADRAGLGWLAVEALEQRAPNVGLAWPLLVADGFDSFTPIQIALLRTLASRVGQMVIALTGTMEGAEKRIVHCRFDRTRQALEEALGIQAQPLPHQNVSRSPALTHLEAHLFRLGPAAEGEGRPAVEDGSAVELIEAPDRAGEVRAALRWLKARLVQDQLSIQDAALLARDIAPYRPFIQEIAGEFGLPLRLVDGLPLRSNPAIAALLELLRLMLPTSEEDSEPALPRRSVVEAWRSPYFDWSALPAEGATHPIGIAPGDADALDSVARWGRVIEGQSQWEEVLQKLTGRSRDAQRGTESDYDEEQGIPAAIPVGPAGQVLWAKFCRFVQRLTPPAGQQTYRDWVQWLEGLIGPDPDLQAARFPLADEPTALQVVACARAGQDAAAERDLAALEALKDVLRGLVWAEEALSGTEAVDYVQFMDELTGAVEATSYRLPVHSDREELLVADVVQARGLPFRAVAVLGLAEGEFPATLGEDPFVRDADREAMRQDFALPLESSAESAEVEFFYETITRPSQRLLLTRPRLADNGALWQTSPFWEEVCRLARLEPCTLTSETVLPPNEAASWPELMQSLAAHGGYGAVRDWVRQVAPESEAAVEHAAHVLRLRRGDEKSALDGELAELAPVFARKFGADHVWSASRLESYRSCPFSFFVGKVLGLEPRPEPTEGLDMRQLGNIYHRILQRVYQAPAVDDPSDLPLLLDALAEVATAVLDAAPEQEGFRATAWWHQTREEILGNVRLTLEELARMAEDYVPCGFELPFGFGERPPLTAGPGGERFQLHGYIDRVEQANDGTLRIIDYKTGGPSGYTKQKVAAGKKLQLPLYALAARDALELGKPVDGYYWHVQHAERSGFTLRAFDGGPQGAMRTAVEYAWQAVQGARAGHFVPATPDEGCPSYCPAAGFCWHLRPRFEG